MRKIGLIAGVVVLVAAAGWSALWLVGRNSVADRLDREIARLEAEGYEVAHGRRSIGGFPFAYDVTFEDVVVTGPDGGLRYELPTIAGVATLRDPGALRFLFPPQFRAVVVLGETAELRESGLPERLAFDVEAEDLVVETSPPDGPLMEFDVDAASLMMVSVEGEDAALGVAVELGGLDAMLSVPAGGSVAPYRGRASVARLDYVLSLLDPEGVRTTVEGLGDAITLSAVSTLRTAEQWRAMLEDGAGAGTAELVYQSGPAVSQVRVQGAGEGMDGTLVQEVGTGGGVVRLGEGRVELRASSQNNVYRLAPDAAGQPIRGGFSLTSFEAVYDAPVAPTETMQPFTLRLALSGLEAEEAVWTLVDPGGTLDREAGHLVAELTGTGRLLPPPDDGSTAMRGLEPGRLEIVVASLDALGAEVTAEGAVEFLQPLNLPVGEMTLRAENLLEVIGKLTDLGLLQAGTYQAAALMAALYARGEGGENTLVAEITFTPEGITVNGLPVR